MTHRSLENLEFFAKKQDMEEMLDEAVAEEATRLAEGSKTGDGNVTQGECRAKIKNVESTTFGACSPLANKPTRQPQLVTCCYVSR